MKFGQLIEHSMKTIFLEKSYLKCGGETIPRPFSKKKRDHCKPLNLVHIIQSIFKKQRGMVPVSPFHFLYDF